MEITELEKREAEIESILLDMDEFHLSDITDLIKEYGFETLGGVAGVIGKLIAQNRLSKVYYDSDEVVVSEEYANNILRNIHHNIEVEENRNEMENIFVKWVWK